MAKIKPDLEEESDKTIEEETPNKGTIKLTVSEVEDFSETAKEIDLEKEVESISAIDNLYADKKVEEEASENLSSKKVEEKPKDVIIEKEKEINMDSSPILTTSQPKRNSAKSGFWLFVGGLLVGGLVTGGIFGFIINPKNTDLNKPETTDETVQEPTVEPTVATVEEVDYSLYSVEVLNGSGVTGAASAVKALIADLGFDQIETGNASVSDQEETWVQFKSSVPENVYGEITKLLVGYNTVKEEDLADSADFDIQITVGTKSEN